MKIYLAGPVVTDELSVKQEIEILEMALREMEHPTEKIEVYRPGKHKVPNAWGIDMPTWAQCVFTMDVIAIDECDWVVVADYGRKGTSGTSWEAGYSFAKGKKILVVQMPNVEESSLMTQGCASNICRYTDFIHVSCPNEDRWKRFFYERGRQLNQEVVLN